MVDIYTDQELQTVDVAMEEDGGWKIYAREREDGVEDDEVNVDFELSNPFLTSFDVWMEEYIHFRTGKNLR